jgi:hypothetical protein
MGLNWHEPPVYHSDMLITEYANPMMGLLWLGSPIGLWLGPRFHQKLSGPGFPPGSGLSHRRRADAPPFSPHSEFVGDRLDVLVVPKTQSAIGKSHKFPRQVTPLQRRPSGLVSKPPPYGPRPGPLRGPEPRAPAGDRERPPQRARQRSGAPTAGPTAGPRQRARERPTAGPAGRP